MWARLRHEGVRAGKPRILRLMRTAGLLAPQRAGSPHGPRVHDGTITTEVPDVMWGTDATATHTVHDGPVTVFVAVDHCASEAIGLHAARRADRFEALEPVRQGVRRHFGGPAPDAARGLSLRHDHGSQYMSRHFQQEIGFLGIRASPSFVREPQGNGVAERFIRTLKEQLLWIRDFDTVEELNQALQEWRILYNERWLAPAPPTPFPRTGPARAHAPPRRSVITTNSLSEKSGGTTGPSSPRSAGASVRAPLDPSARRAELPSIRRCDGPSSPRSAGGAGACQKFRV